MQCTPQNCPFWRRSALKHQSWESIEVWACSDYTYPSMNVHKKCPLYYYYQIYAYIPGLLYLALHTSVWGVVVRMMRQQSWKKPHILDLLCIGHRNQPCPCQTCIHWPHPPHFKRMWPWKPISETSLRKEVSQDPPLKRHNYRQWAHHHLKWSWCERLVTER